MKAIVHADSSGAKGVAARRGAGRIRHIQTQTLWLQEVIARRVLKIDGKINPADIGTKVLGSAAMCTSILDQLGIIVPVGELSINKKAAV